MTQYLFHKRIIWLNQILRVICSPKNMFRLLGFQFILASSSIILFIFWLKVKWSNHNNFLLPKKNCQPYVVHVRCSANSYLIELQFKQLWKLSSCQSINFWLLILLVFVSWDYSDSWKQPVIYLNTVALWSFVGSSGPRRLNGEISLMSGVIVVVLSLLTSSVLSFN